MATKADQEKEIKSLKAEIRQLRSEEKSFSAELESLTKTAFDVIIDGRDYQLVTVKYDPESKKGIVSEINNLGPSLAVAINKGKRLMIGRVLDAKKEKESK